MPDTIPDKSNARYKRLYFQSSHRGTKELDIILGRFAEQHLHTLTEQQLDDYEKLLDTTEAMLFDWLTEQREVEAKFDTEVFRMICDAQH